MLPLVIDSRLPLQEPPRPGYLPYRVAATNFADARDDVYRYRVMNE